MKLVYVLENYFPNIGGVETLFKTLIETLATQGHQITIITSKVAPNLPLKEKNGNIQIIRIPFNNRYLFTFLGIFYVLPYTRRADLIHTTSYNAAIPAFLAAKIFSKKVIITFHEVWSDLWFRLPYMGKISKYAHFLFEYFLLKLPFHQFIGVSKSTSKNLIKAGIDPQKVKTIYNGINYAEFQTTPRNLNVEDNCFTFTYFGRLGISKGLDLLTEAASSILKKHPKIRLQLIVPKTPYSFLKKIEDAKSQYKLGNQLVFRHHLPFEELKKALVSSDCVVIPSYSEGFCFSAVEAIALGVPVISSDQTALKEVVSGKFIKMKQLSSEGIIGAMEQAIRGEWQVSPIKKFHLQHTVEQYQMLYQEL